MSDATKFVPFVVVEDCDVEDGAQFRVRLVATPTLHLVQACCQRKGEAWADGELIAKAIGLEFRS